MRPWRQFPLIRPVIAIIPGLLTGLYVSCGNGIILFLISIFYLSFFVLVIGSVSRLPFNFRWLPGIVIQVLLFLLSWAYGSGYVNKQKCGLLTDINTLKNSYLGKIVEPVNQKTKTTRAVVWVDARQIKGKWCKYRKKVLVYLQKDKCSSKLFFGDRILFLAAPSEPPGPVTPYTFDYKKYLRLRGIRLQAFVESSQWMLIPDVRPNSPQSIALHLRNKLLGVFRDNGIKGREFAVGSALLLGYTDEIDPGLITDYSATGAMHILSVSGMHVGMIYIVLEQLLLFLKRFKHGIIVKAVLVVIFVWFYAMMTGLSPCVMRAAAMISLITVSKALQRSSEILNPLLASLLFLLVLDPNFIMDTGFQLSYMAIAGIIFLYKPIHVLYSPSAWLSAQVWGVIAVSIAAQIGTFPLSLYYFHQFPNYFILTNIIVIPLSNLIIYSGILMLSTGSIPVISILFAKALTFMIWSMNAVIHVIEGFPFSSTKGIFLNIGELFLLYGLITGICLFLFSKRRKFLFMALIFLILLAGISVFRKIEILGREKMVVYRFRETSAIEFIQQNKGILMGNKIYRMNDFTAAALQNMRNVLGYRECYRFLTDPLVRNREPFKSEAFYRRGNFILFNGLRIIIVNNTFRAKGMHMMKADMLVITGNPRIEMKSLLQIFTCREIIIDSSTPKWKIRKWKTEAARMGVQCYSVDESGIYLRDF